MIAVAEMHPSSMFTDSTTDDPPCVAAYTPDYCAGPRRTIAADDINDVRDQTEAANTVRRSRRRP